MFKKNRCAIYYTSSKSSLKGENKKERWHGYFFLKGVVGLIVNKVCV